jgi:hypothetical protein
LKRNEIQIDIETIGNFIGPMVLQEKNKNKNNIYIYKKNTNTKRHLFIPLYLGINYIDYSLKLSKECLMTPKVVLPKPNLKNHPH